MLCPKCKSGHVHRERRTQEERWRYAAVFECYDCHHRVGVSYLRQLPRPSLRSILHLPWITFHARCPRCGEMTLRVKHERDYVEGYQSNPLRTLQKLLGAPLYYCWECRLQFYDLRPRRTADAK